MKPDQKMIVTLTFLTGMFAGAALYILVFAPEFKASPVAERGGTSIVGEMYGGCSFGDSCPSFRLEDDGSYMYLMGGERTKGRLSRELSLEVFSLVSDHRLASHAAQVEKDDCDSYTDGIDYHYEIMLDQKRYVLDTCDTSLSYGSELQRSMNRVWQYLDGSGGSEGYQSENGGFSGWLERQLRE